MQIVQYESQAVRHCAMFHRPHSSRIRRCWTFTIADRPIEPGQLEPRHILTPQELAKRLKVEATWVYDQTRQRAITRNADPLPCIRLGKLLRFYWPEVEKWLERRQGGYGRA
jgi:hypothetical protein